MVYMDYGYRERDKLYPVSCYPSIELKHLFIYKLHSFIRIISARKKERPTAAQTSKREQRGHQGEE